MGQGTLSKYIQKGMTPELLTPSLPVGMEHPKAMLSNIQTMLDRQQDTKRWLASLPDVQLKPKYMFMAGPVKTRQGCSRPSWPQRLAKDFVDLVDFRDYLQHFKCKTDDVTKVLSTGAGRAIGMLQIKATRSVGSLSPTNVRVLVGMFASSTHIKMMNLPLLDPEFMWTDTILRGLSSYAKYQLRSIVQEDMEGHLEFAEQYQWCLHTLVDDLRGGLAKLCGHAQEEGHRHQAKEDGLAIQDFPPVPLLQEAVREGYFTLAYVTKMCVVQQEVPYMARVACNTVLAGAIHYDTYAGRIWEWEHLDAIYMQGVLAANQRHIVCQHHKTARCYGDIAKKLTPGLFAALVDYSKLPRPAACKHFFVAPKAQGENTISMHKYLKAFNQRYLGASPVHPTTNLVRKLFHNSLMKLTETKEKLMELMTQVDAHSKTDMEMQHLLKTPAGDVKLADALIASILGETVAYPTPEELEYYIEEDTVWAEYVGNICNANTSPAPEECEALDAGSEGEDEQPLDWWNFAELFGIKKPTFDMPVLADAPTAEPTPLEKLLRAEAQAARNPSQGSNASGQPGQSGGSRGRQPMLTDAQYQWVTAKAVTFGVGVPPEQWIRGLVEAAVQEGILVKEEGVSDDTYVEQFRHVCRVRSFFKV